MLSLGRFSKSGESYAFNRSGTLISESRFNQQLVDLGLIKTGQHSALNLQIRDPGGNLLEGYQPDKSRQNQPWTRMAEYALRGNSGSDMSGYRDYRGVPVVGAWLWNDQLDMGLATEINYDEAFASYYVMRWSIFGVLGLMLTMSLGGTTFTLYIGEKASRVIRRSRDELEAQVSDRTLELQLQIRERRYADKQLEQFKNTLDRTLDCVFMFDAEDLRFFYVNEGALQHIGYTRDELLNMHPYDIKPAFSEARFRELVAPLLSGNQALLRFETSHQHKNGALIPVEAFLQYMAPEDESPRFVAIVRDVTERKKQEALLHEAKNTAERANQAKSEFLSSMSHELRTPLNAILGFAQILELEENLSQDQKHSANMIYRAGGHLLSLINEILELARIESGQVELNMENVSISGVLDECKVLIEPLARSRGITLDLVPSQCSNLVLKTDHIRFKQVLLNLVSNAVKYNRDNGFVGVSCTTTDSNFVRISITDTGPGIAEDKINNLFQPFNRLGAEFGETEGTGIGLVISKQLVELMEGNIGVESTSGKGTTFWVELAASPPAEPEADADAGGSVISSSLTEVQEISASATRILVAEDNKANQEVLQKQLQLLGLTADYAENGVKAWQLWQKENYDLLLTDIRMPLMDGYALVDKIRKAEQQTGKHTPIIAISASAMEEDARRCLDSGMDVFISKPVNIQELQTTLKNWLSN